MTAPLEHREVAEAHAGAAYSHVVLDDRYAYCAGQLAADAVRPVPLGDIEVETRAAMDLLGSVLESVGLSFADVVRVGVFLTDLGEFERMNAVYASYFEPGRLPARTCVGVASLLAGTRVEIDCVARRRTG